MVWNGMNIYISESFRGSTALWLEYRCGLRRPKFESRFYYILVEWLLGKCSISIIFKRRIIVSMYLSHMNIKWVNIWHLVFQSSVNPSNIKPTSLFFCYFLFVCFLACFSSEYHYFHFSCYFLTMTRWNWQIWIDFFSNLIKQD